VVRGNWDTDNWFRIDLYAGTGAQELNGDTRKIQVAGIPVWVAGLAYDNPRALENTIRSIPSNEFSLLLYHSPDLMTQAIAEHVDLYCAGHTHGGQVALPLYGAIITLAKSGKRYEAGLYHEEDTSLYVTRGVGMAGGYLPRVRFWSRPELTVIDVTSASK
jgi:predicted MPP superfamily phosphohydrolase